MRQLDDKESDVLLRTITRLETKVPDFWLPRVQKHTVCYTMRR